MADRCSLEANSVALVEALGGAQEEIPWAASALAAYTEIQAIYGVYSSSSPSESAWELQQKIKDLEKYVSMDLERHLAMRNGRSPFYFGRVNDILQRAQQIVWSSVSGAESGHESKELDHVSAELQATFVEYGFCSAFEAIYNVGEAQKKLQTLKVKLDEVEKSLKDDAGVCLAELYDVMAGVTGIQQAMTEANVAKMQHEFADVNERVTRLENNISSANIKGDSEMFIHYLAAQSLLNKIFVASIFRADIAEAVNSHLIHPGTRGWLLERTERWYHDTEKRLFVLAGKQGSGKTALVSALCKLHTNDIVACHFFDSSLGENKGNHMNGLVQSISSSLCQTVPEYLNYLDDQYGEMDLKARLSRNWRESYEVLLREPLQALYGTGKGASAGARRKMIVIDALDECAHAEWDDLKAFIVAFSGDFSASLCLFVTVRSKYMNNLIPPDQSFSSDSVRLEERAWVNRHIKDVEIYIASSLGAILSGEDKGSTPCHAKADESTLHRAQDELLKTSSGRFDFAIELIESFAKEMHTSGQFLSSLKKATGPVRTSHANVLDQKMSDFSSPYRAYRDKEGRGVDVRVMRQSHYLMDKTRVALIRGRHKVAE